ncbi:hypothetical protein K2173_017312 [Erythroxylum novogranatense]|uniref:Peroxiredoxin Q, chloroplastic n=1 Tax=Erythroxylum novogranatense TaxID=1862640 RepID=A0AAV8TMX8_9ROSI|nr:hypothetical protein K2173_017312 [Erythroxylum novogranatense]
MASILLPKNYIPSLFPTQKPRTSSQSPICLQIIEVPVNKGQIPPSFTLNDQDGKNVTLSKFKGKPAFANKYRLPFTLLSDDGNKVRKDWGVPSDLFGALPGRQTYVLDKNGVVQLIYNNLFQREKHIDETLKLLQSL